MKVFEDFSHTEAEVFAEALFEDSIRSFYKGDIDPLYKELTKYNIRLCYLDKMYVFLQVLRDRGMAFVFACFSEMITGSEAKRLRYGLDETVRSLGSEHCFDELRTASLDTVKLNRWHRFLGWELCGKVKDNNIWRKELWAPQ